MKAIMISIKSEWVEKILNGEKTIEIRKTMPKCDLPIKCYIYCTKQKTNRRKNLFVNEKTAREKYGITSYWSSDDEIEIINENMVYLADEFKTHKANGKVVAEFTLNKITKHKKDYIDVDGAICYNFKTYEVKACGFDTDLKSLVDFDWFVTDYGGGKPLYAWHINNLKIYDKPKDLMQFSVCANCSNCYKFKPQNERFSDCNRCKEFRTLTRPPQSWCYVEE